MTTMGLNPFRGGNNKATPLDIAMVAGAVLVTLIAVGWGLFG